MYNYEDFKWTKNNKLYTKRRYTGIYLKPHPVHTDLYNLYIYDRMIDYYNLTRAKDNGINLAMSIGNRIGVEARLKPTGEFLEGAR